MTDEVKEEKEESTSITSHTTRERNLIPGIKDSHLALGVAGLAGLGIAYIAAKPMIDTFIQNMALARQNQAPPPPPPVAQQAQVVAQQPQLAEPTNEYVDETPEQTVNMSVASEPSPNGGGNGQEGAELGEVDHRNYQTTRRRQRQATSPFGASIARG